MTKFVPFKSLILPLTLGVLLIACGDKESAESSQEAQDFTPTHSQVTQEWLGEGTSIDVFSYKSNDSNSPAAFSSIDSTKLDENLQKGQKIYSKWCLACHGEGMPGTKALAVVYKDSGLPALLEEREDLEVDTISLFVRLGKHSMPFFRKSEISDSELKLLADYLANAHKYR